MIIKARNIRKSYGNVHVLKGIDLSIIQGEILSIVGASGAGKTTLLQILGTLDMPDEGVLEINNQPVFEMNDKELAKFRNAHIGFVFQFHQLLPEFTALENVMIPGMIAKKNKRTIEKRAKELFEILGIAERLNHKPSELSGGEQQRVAVARALINNPAVVFADEPSGNLDSKNAESLHHLFLELKKQFNQTFVIVTHNEKLAELSDRMIKLKDGQIEFIKEITH